MLATLISSGVVAHSVSVYNCSQTHDRWKYQVTWCHHGCRRLTGKLAATRAVFRGAHFHFFAHESRTHTGRGRWHLAPTVRRCSPHGTYQIWRRYMEFCSNCLHTLNQLHFILLFISFHFSVSSCRFNGVRLLAWWISVVMEATVIIIELVGSIDCNTESCRRPE